jgi:hypothetical protein
MDIRLRRRFYWGAKRRNPSAPEQRLGLLIYDHSWRMQCAEKLRLLGEYEEKVRLYAAAVGDLSANRPTTAIDRYIELKDVAEEARRKCEDARYSVERHTAAHGC